MLIGFVLMLAGVVFPLLMVLQVLPSTFLLNFFSYGASVSGLFMGIIGVTSYVQETRGKK
jgi:hypothetical protein